MPKDKVARNRKIQEPAPRMTPTVVIFERNIFKACVCVHPRKNLEVRCVVYVHIVVVSDFRTPLSFNPTFTCVSRIVAFASTLVSVYKTLVSCL